jgi:transcription elongation factor Elf1
VSAPSTYRVRVDMTCPTCGCEALNWVTQSRPDPRQMSAVLKCGECRRETLMTVRLIDIATADIVAAPRRSPRTKEPAR